MKQLNEEEVKIYQLGILNLAQFATKGIFLGMMILILECCGQILTDL